MLPKNQTTVKETYFRDMEGGERTTTLVDKETQKELGLWMGALSHGTAYKRYCGAIRRAEAYAKMPK